MAVASIVAGSPRVAPHPRPESRAVRTSTARDPRCPAAQHWEHSFPRSYLGSVFALVTTADGGSATVQVDLLWGRWHHRSTVLVTPTRPDGTGGTELVFAKTGGVVGLNPDLVLVSTVPVCVRFGLGPDPRAPGSVVDANPGWDFSAQPWT